MVAFNQRGSWVRFAGISLLGIALSTALAVANFKMHFNLSTASSLQLLLIVLMTLRFGFKQASVVSLMAVLSLDFLFTTPVFQVTVDQPEDWVALFTFEATALVVSALANKVRMHAAQAELERSRNLKLYELSRAILLIDPQRLIREQLVTLIRDVIEVREVELSDVYSASGVYSEGLLVDFDFDDAETGVSRRRLSIGTRPIGRMVLRGWETNEAMAHGIASLVAVALERAHALDKQNRAEAARQTEILRTTVLDGLAHAIKTPLTGIMMASSGLLAVGELTAMQAELMTVINDEAITLNTLTTHLLQTAALEAREVKLHPSLFTMASAVEEILNKEGEALRSRVRLTVPDTGAYVRADPQLVTLALSQLIDNAAKYSPVGSLIDITVNAEGAETHVIVRNKGAEIGADERERIFERFYRGADSAHGPAGTGLGLSIVKKAAEAHHGHAWVECEDGAVKFFFTLRNGMGKHHG